MPVQQSKVPDFKNLPIDEAFKKEISMPLLRMPEKKPKPKLVPAAELAAFEKKRKRKEESFRYSSTEKENIKPKKNQEQQRRKSGRENDARKAGDQFQEDLRHTMSR
jgi:hypothetical protein